MLENFSTPTSIVESLIFNDEMPIKVLLQPKHVHNSPYSLLKIKLEKIKAQLKVSSQSDCESKIIPDTIHFSSSSSSHSEKAAHDSKVIEIFYDF